MSAQSACRRRAPALACAIPHLQGTGAPFRRELEGQMRIAALLESSRHSNVEDRLRPVALQAGERERRCMRGRTSHGPHGECGSAAWCGARLRGRDESAHTAGARQDRYPARAGA